MKKTSCKGSGYKYLGHFSKQKFLDAGHNTSGKTKNGHWIELPDPEESEVKRGYAEFAQGVKRGDPTYHVAPGQEKDIDRIQSELADRAIVERRRLKGQGLKGAQLQEAMDEWLDGQEDD